MAQIAADNAPGTGRYGAPGTCPGGRKGGDAKSLLADQKSRRLADVYPECDGKRLRSIQFCHRPKPYVQRGNK